MVLSSLMLLAIANPSEFTKSFSGVWASNTGNLMIIREGNVVIHDPERVVDCNALTVNDAGNLYFRWIGNGKDMPAVFSADQYFNKTREKISGFGALIGTPESKTFFGEGLITLGRPDGRNVIRELRVEANKASGPRYMLNQFTFAGPLRIISLAGRFGSDRTNITIGEEFDAKEKNFQITGKLVVDGIECSLKGARIHDRSVVFVYDPVRSTKIGDGVLFWRPTNDGVRKIMARDTTETDQVLAFFNVKGVALRSPEKIFMPRMK